MTTATRFDRDVTSLLRKAGAGERAALDELMPLVYAELRSLAACYMSHERPDHLLRTTGLVHEAYLRLVGSDGLHWDDRRQFYALAAEAMRRILIEHARRRDRPKHGGDRIRVPLSVTQLVADGTTEEILSLDAAIGRLEEEAPDVAEIVRLRFYGGLSVEHTARTLGVSSRTVNRAWSYARAWLYRQLEQEYRQGTDDG
jgi:RNA polymerase sigma factor (TIGR02999 family)